MNDDCIYKDVCKTECDKLCLRYLEMKYLLESSGIPKAQQSFHRLRPDDCDLQAFEKLAKIQSNIVDFTKNGDTLYIYSEYCGNGKTTWTIKLMLQYFNEIWSGNGFEQRGIFINVPTFLSKSKLVISTPDPEFEDLRNQLANVDLVIFDDITATKLSNYDYTTLLSYIDQRVFQKKATIFTGNFTPSNLNLCVGERLSSRIQQGIQIEFKGKDRR